MGLAEPECFRFRTKSSRNWSTGCPGTSFTDFLFLFGARRRGDALRLIAQ